MAGMAIRALRVAETLGRAGHEVLLACPGGVEDGFGAGVRTADSSARGFARSVSGFDLAVVSGHAVGRLSGFDGALVADLYDPFLIENLSVPAARADSVFRNDRRALLLLVDHADFLLSASEEQRLFYL